MREEYLETEEYENYQNLVTQADEAVKQEETSTTADEKLTFEEYFPPLHPIDFDCHSDDAMLRKLLKKFQMIFLYPFFKAYDITYRSLRYLSVDDINTVIRSVGHRAEFREKLFAWRRKRYRTNNTQIIEFEKSYQTVTSEEIPRSSQSADNKSNKSNKSNPIMIMETNEEIVDGANDTSSLQEMMNELPLEMEVEAGGGAPASKRPRTETIVNLRETRLGALLNLEELIEESVFGTIIKVFYNRHGYLERKHRDEIINTIVDYVVTKEIKLHSSDFGKIVDMIVNLFPAEEEARDYYFINRKGKRNPMGRLYTKYYNTLKRIRVRDIHQEFTNESMCSFLQTGSLKDDTSKTKKASTAVLTNEATTSASANQTNSINTTDDNKNSNNNSNTQIEFIADDFEELLESNDTSSSTAKDVLRCQGLNWDNVKTLWSQTHLIRQEDIEHSTVKDVIQQWPKYLNARGMELFDIDFRLKFSRNKENLLQRKWSRFVQKICYYYQSNIKDEMCKGLFALWKTKPGKDTEDYILIVLLNSIIIPMARYRDAAGNRRKVSIVEAVDLFAVRVNHLEELDQKREEFCIKFGEIHTEFTPLIVVVGDNNINIHEIYVHFHVALYEMPDFLTALDCCMKIYRVLNLPFPASNDYVWTFIQRYFYEIQLPDDTKCPSMSSLITYLKN
ncbi:uncharacterized protein LOC101897248 [Musca domestica]|uniref:Uncharacterized protein LOC101897248 n=1 Tax=Musca domestica TaxID=7370 RepID=A0A1I8MZN8_MUSDO|nr:uncharacterized protein LOC101897248 [Musca domestica]